VDVIGPNDLDVVCTPQVPAPTETQYSFLEFAYRYFNQTLFESRLPPCLITLQRKNGTLGYYSRGKFASLSDNEARTDELALNPQHFRERGARDVCSTIVHEQVHLAQHHFGKPARKGYHDKKWAAAMKAIGLQPTSTGQPGGAETGYKMDHIVVEGGPFALAYEAFERTGATLAWGDAQQQSAKTSPGGASPEVPEPKPAAKRVKFVCLLCGFNVYASPRGAGRIACIPCGGIAMVTA
jgi:hypothetical protein